MQGPIGAAAMSEKSAAQSDHSSMAEVVNHPPHYNKGIETTKYIKSWDMSYAQGNVIKYVGRFKFKGNPLQDLKKASWYLNKLIKETESWDK